MKSQMMRFTKSTMAVILSLCMLVSCMTVGIIATDAAQSAEERVGAKVDDENLGDTTYYMHIGVGAAFTTNTAIAFTYDSTNSIYYASYELTANSEYPMVICTTSGSLGNDEKLSSNQSVNSLAASYNPDSIQFDYFEYKTNNYSGYDCFKFKTQTAQTVYFTFTSTSSGLVVRSSLSGGGGEGGGDNPEPSGDTTTDTINQTSGKTILVSWDTNTSYVWDYVYFYSGFDTGHYSMTAPASPNPTATYPEVYYKTLYDSGTGDTAIKFILEEDDLWSGQSADIEPSGFTKGKQWYTIRSSSGHSNKPSPDSNGEYTALKLSTITTPSSIIKDTENSLTVNVDGGLPWFLSSKRSVTTGKYKLTVTDNDTQIFTKDDVLYATKSFTVPWTPSSSGSHTLVYTLTDGIDTVSYSKAYTVVDTACTSVSLSQSPANGTIYENETSVTYTATATGAQTDVTYNFKVDGTSVQNTSSTTYSTTFTSAGTKSVTVTVEKSGYGSVTSSAVSTEVISRPAVYLRGLKNDYTWNEDDANKMTYNPTTGLYEIMRNLYSGETTYNGGNGFKFYHDSTYYGKDSTTITSSSTTATGLSDSGGNINLTTKDLSSVTSSKVPYKFTYNKSTQAMAVYYPMKVTYNMQSHGTNPSANGYVVAYGSTITAPTAPTEAGYTFGGWYKESSCTNAWDFSTDTVTADTVLYAKWTQNVHTISYPATTTGYDLDESKPTTAHYNDTIRFTVTPLANYRIDSVTYTPDGESPINCTTEGNNEYQFTMPDKNVTVTINMIETRTVTLTAGTGIASKQYKIGSGDYVDYSAPFTVDKNSIVTFKVTYSNGYEFNSKSDNVTASSNNTVFTTGAITSDTTVTITASKIDYKITTSISSGNGTLKLYSDSSCTTELAKKSFSGTQYYTAQVGDIFYAKYTVESVYYTFSSYSISGTDSSIDATSGNIGTFTMGYSDAALTTTVVATTPSIVAPDITVYANESFTYSDVTGLSVEPAAGSGTPITLYYSFNSDPDNYGTTNTFTAPDERGTYTLNIKARNAPQGVAAVETVKTVNITVIYRVHEVTYYIDVHDNNSMDVAKTVTVSITNEAGTVIKKDNNGADCSKTLDRANANTTVFSKKINTPVISNEPVYVKVSYVDQNSVTHSKVEQISSTWLSTLTSNEVVWIEAVYEKSQVLDVVSKTRTEPDIPSGSMDGYTISPESAISFAVSTASGCSYKAYTNSKREDYKVKLPLKRGDNTITGPGSYSYTFNAPYTCDYVLAFSYDSSAVTKISLFPIARRLYLEKPYSWQDDHKAWEHISVYHWGGYTDIGWDNAIPMYYLGYDNTSATGKHYYYVDIPKTITTSSVSGGVQTDTENQVKNILFKGWGTKDNKTVTDKTLDITNISDTKNCYTLSDSGGDIKGTVNDVIEVSPNYSKYKDEVKMNKNEPTVVNIAPTIKDGAVTYSSSNENVVTVASNGNVEPHGSGTAAVTVTVKGTVGAKLNGTTYNGGDALSYTVSVQISDPGKFRFFKLMSLESATYTLNVPKMSNNDQPGYFDMSGVEMTVSGIQGVDSSTKSAIITTPDLVNPDPAKTVTVNNVVYPTTFTVTYAKDNTYCTNYGDIGVTGSVTTKSMLETQSHERYGLDHWEKFAGSTPASPQPDYTKSRTIGNGVETVVTQGIVFGKVSGDNNFYDTFNAVFAKYNYVDVTFVYEYYEYNPELDKDGMINYPYDTTWAGNESFGDAFNKKAFTVTDLDDSDVKGSWQANANAAADTPCVSLDVSAVSSEGGDWYAWTWGEGAGSWITGTRSGDIITFADNDVDNNIVFVRMNSGDARDWANVQNKTVDLSSRSHNKKTYTVTAHEVRGQVADENLDIGITPESIVNDAVVALGVAPNNNYYSYTIDDSTITISNRDTVNHTATATVKMIHTPKTYSVYLNGVLNSNSYYYQAKAELSLDSSYTADSYLWYAVNDNSLTPDDSTDPVLAQGKNYSFRVKGNTNLKTVAGSVSDDDFNRSEVDFSHYEVIHRDNPQTQQQELVDYLLQNFYIADFFSPEKVLDYNRPNSTNTGYLPYDEAEFVGGGVVYFSVDKDTGLPRSRNAVNLGYVDDSGTINEDAVKEMIKDNIEAQYTSDGVSGEVGEEEAMKIAYGTEIEAHQHIENNMKSGVLFRYLPLNQYDRDGNGVLVRDSDNNFTFKVNTNTFRYSNSLQSYQYVYASGNENKETNNGRNMRLYSYYVYSYVTYNKDTNVPETKYEIVLSDNYSDASTYWDGTN